MIRPALTLALLAACGAAQAQHAPRVVFDVALPAADDLRLNHFALGPQLAVGADGTHYVLQHLYAPGTVGAARAARIDLLALGRDGALRWRRTLPIEEKMRGAGFSLATLAIAAIQSGELVVVSSSDDYARGAPSAPERSRFAGWLRLGADGGVRKATAIGPPRLPRGDELRHAHYYVHVLAPTSDNAVLVGGAFGAGLYSWWMGKFSLDGVRLWQAGGRDGYSGRVAALGRRLDGSWISLASDGQPEEPRRWDIARQTADGKLLARRRGPSSNALAAAVLREGSVFATQHEDRETPQPQMLMLVDDSGRLRGQRLWPFAYTTRIIADGDGFAAIVHATTDADSKVLIVRCDPRGAIRWHAEADAAEILRTADGHIVALVHWGKDKEQRRLVRYADP